MCKLEWKKESGKRYAYLVANVYVLAKLKKIKVYLGKSVPKNLSPFLKKLAKKELELLKENIDYLKVDFGNLTDQEILKLEKDRIHLKYLLNEITTYQASKLWRRIAIRFIFESNALEGSKLAASEVEAIIKKKYVKKSLPKNEVIEVNNAIEAFELILSGKFKLNQRGIIALHKLLTRDLGIPSGYKKHNIVVNNKATTPPGSVKKEIGDLIQAYSKVKKNQFAKALEFHQKFERIHPFEDGNGRTGRMILLWMLLESGYGLILFTYGTRKAYFEALDQADNGRFDKLFRLSIKSYSKTVKTIEDLI